MEDNIRRYINTRRMEFIETLPTQLFSEGFPGLKNYQRDEIKTALTARGYFMANSNLLDAMSKIDDFPSKFIAFCDQYECCLDLARRINEVKESRRRSAQGHRRNESSQGTSQISSVQNADAGTSQHMPSNLSQISIENNEEVTPIFEIHHLGPIVDKNIQTSPADLFVTKKSTLENVDNQAVSATTPQAQNVSAAQYSSMNKSSVMVAASSDDWNSVSTPSNCHTLGEPNIPETEEDIQNFAIRRTCYERTLNFKGVQVQCQEDLQNYKFLTVNAAYKEMNEVSLETSEESSNTEVKEFDVTPVNNFTYMEPPDKQKNNSEVKNNIVNKTTVTEKCNARSRDSFQDSSDESFVQVLTGPKTDRELQLKEGIADTDLRLKEGNADKDLELKESNADKDLELKEGNANTDLKLNEGNADTDLQIIEDNDGTGLQLKEPNADTDLQLNGDNANTDLQLKDGNDGTDLRVKEGNVEAEHQLEEVMNGSDLTTINSTLSSEENLIQANEENNNSQQTNQSELHKQMLFSDVRTQVPDNFQQSGYALYSRALRYFTSKLTSLYAHHVGSEVDPPSYLIDDTNTK